MTGRPAILEGVPGPLPPLPDEDHRCAECGISYSSIAVDASIDVIRHVPDGVADAVLALPDRQLRARPSAGTWSALEYVCHLRDVYAVYTIRLYRTRVEDTPTLEPMFNDLRAVRFRYNQREVRPVVAELRDNVAGLLDEAARNTERTWERTARRLPSEARTARWLIRQAAHEGLHHVRDLHGVLDRVAPPTS
jgi:hypothetical protein